MSRIAWKLYDPVALETYSFPVNPYSDSSSYSYNKNIGYSSNAYYNDKTVVYDAQPQARRFSYQGRVYFEQDYNDLNTWFNKQNRLVLQDDLGIRYYIYMETLEFQRVRSQSFPWKHTYTLTGTTLVGTPDPIV